MLSNHFLYNYLFFKVLLFLTLFLLLFLQLFLPPFPFYPKLRAILARTPSLCNNFDIDFISLNTA